jgi:hypothetical protein
MVHVRCKLQVVAVSKTYRIASFFALAELESNFLRSLPSVSSTLLCLCSATIMHSAAGSARDKAKRVRIPSAKASESAAAGKHAAAASEDVKAIKEADSPAPVKQPSAEKPSHGEETLLKKLIKQFSFEKKLWKNWRCCEFSTLACHSGGKDHCC